jgi:hypothetical protein
LDNGENNHSIPFTKLYIKYGSIALLETPPLMIYEKGEWYFMELIFNRGNSFLNNSRSRSK